MLELAVKKISERVWYGSQSVNFERIFALGEKRIRFRIKVDAYDFQSSGVAEIWNGERWNRIHVIPGEELKSTKKTSYVTKNVTIKVFAPDIDELERVTQAVLL